MNWMFLDLNAYFASVEQQVHPQLRDKPVAVVPVMADSTCCIAVSYEAKAYGIKTGTRVRDAKALCPGIQLVEGDHALYVQYHEFIKEVIESCIPIDQVVSIDEVICRLTGSQRRPDQAIMLAMKVKQAIRRRVGNFLRSSVGLAPNRYLAKVASDMQKPDGLTVIQPEDLPHVLESLNLQDLCGIGRRMEERLRSHGITSVAALCRLPCDQMRHLWGGVGGERFWKWLRGEDTPPVETHRHSIGHSHVLEPELRTRDGAYQVVKRLSSKAAVRLRKEGLWASGFSLSVQFLDQTSWESRCRIEEAQDTPAFLKAVDHAWIECPSKKPVWVGMTLHPLVRTDRHTPTFFDNPKQVALSQVMDCINDRYGKNTTYFASLSDCLSKVPTRIAFSRVPSMDEF